jgi:hypothetical protein
MGKTALKMAIIFGVFFQHLLLLKPMILMQQSSFLMTIRAKTQHKPK